jgi:hypothetical protein
VKDRREHGRHEATFDLQGAPAQGGSLARMVARNLSLGGLYCTSAADFPEMTRLAVRLMLPADGAASATEPVDLEAVVVRRQERASVSGSPRYELALYFVRLETAARSRIERFLAGREILVEDDV